MQRAEQHRARIANATRVLVVVVVAVGAVDNGSSIVAVREHFDVFKTGKARRRRQTFDDDARFSVNIGVTSLTIAHGRIVAVMRVIDEHDTIQQRQRVAAQTYTAGTKAARKVNANRH